MIFFKDGTSAYITKRFDVKDDETKLAQDNFASLAGRMPQTQGEHYKYLGNYLELFLLMEYKLEAPKLLKVLIYFQVVMLTLRTSYRWRLQWEIIALAQLTTC